jgi:ribose transport system permease protein
MILGLAINDGWGAAPALIVAIATAIGIGFLNGFLIGVTRIPFFVVTLGTLSIYTSFALLTTGGETISLFGVPGFDPIQTLANGSVGPIPNLLLLTGGLYLVGAFVLRYTGYGRAVYAVGSNQEAARLTGINVTAILVSVYTISGLSAGIASMVLVGRLTASGPQVDPNLLLTVIAAVLIGGTAFTGGDGGLLGTVIGVLFLGVIQNGLSISGVSTFWQGTVSGLILIAAVGLGVLREHRLRVRRRRLAVSASPQVE